ncbi:MAG: outer membrane beta-barrel protein [Cytophagales bacterium]|nr:outer membrane beta-barrel protein [Cytophagales bacterium]
MRRLLIISLLSLVNFYAFSQKGKLTGKIVDEETGEELIGATVQIVETGGGAITDLYGNYLLQLDPGTYTLNISYVSYAAQKIEHVVVEAGNTKEINVTMSTDIQLEEIVIQAEAIMDNDVGLLKLQKKALAVQDGITSAEISRVGASDAAESMTYVTGAAIEGGKYMVMRGLGDRYSIVQMNGITMPSADPYRNSVSMDLIPASMIENVTTIKTFVPDKPASFTGGLVDVTTRSLPSDFYLNIDVSTTYNTVSSLRDDFLGDYGTDNRWLGTGSRSKPDVFSQNQDLLSKNTADVTRQKAAQTTDGEPPSPANPREHAVLDEAAKSGKNSFLPKVQKSYIDTGIKLALGNQYTLAGNPLGFNMGLNYKRGFRNYDNMQTGFYSAISGDSLLTEQEIDKWSYSEEVEYGGLLSLSYQFTSNNEITLSTLYNTSIVTEADTSSGFWRNTGRPNYQSQQISHVDRVLWNNQLVGRHVIPSWRDAKIEWSVGYIDLTMDQPDFRGFGFTTSGGNYVMNTSEIGRLPTHFYRNLKDSQVNGQIDFTIPFTENRENMIKFGGSYSSKDREFSENLYGHHREPATRQPGVNDSFISFNRAAGDLQSYFSVENYGLLNNGQTGINEINGEREYGYGILQSDASVLANNYTGNETFIAGYLMGAYEIGKVKLIAGARVETTNMETISADSTKIPTGENDPVTGLPIRRSRNGKIDEVDVLPSLSMIWKINEKTNFRLSGSQTIARPNMREISPFFSVGTPEDPQFLGNQDLKRTKITNLDIRYEIYPRPGELFAVSAYYKQFVDPIVIQNLPQASTPELKPINTEDANVYGVEIELRKSMDFLGEGLKNFRFGANFSYIYSRVSKDSIELAAINVPGIDDWRPLQGQSPYIINVIFNHISPKLNWENTLTYNVFGPRLSFVTEANTPDVYEKPRDMLNFISSKRFGEHVSVGLKIKNILNARFLQEFDNDQFNYLYEGYRVGTSFELSIGYSL